MARAPSAMPCRFPRVRRTRERSSSARIAGAVFCRWHRIEPCMEPSAPYGPMQRRQNGPPSSAPRVRVPMPIRDGEPGRYAGGVAGVRSRSRECLHLARRRLAASESHCSRPYLGQKPSPLRHPIGLYQRKRSPKAHLIYEGYVSSDGPALESRSGVPHRPSFQNTRASVVEHNRTAC